MKPRPAKRFAAGDPQGVDAMVLLREAAIEVRMLYPELFPPGAPWPDNPPNPGRGIYLLGYADGKPVACGALHPIDTQTVEVRRVFVTAHARRAGLAGAMLRELEKHALQFGYTVMRLETGNRQLAAIALYEKHGFIRIPPFGEYVGDPVSVCFEKRVGLDLAQDS
jgi:GNAT superfamily N-acetyltransferase